MRFVVFLGLALVLFGCSGGEEQAVKIDKYFDLAGLLDHQSELLFRKGVRLEKMLMANGEEEEMMITPDSIGQLKAELKLFYEADINKLGLDDAYFTEELPAFNGGKKVINTAKKDGPNVRLIEYDYQEGLLHKIRILVEDKNDIYTFSKEMFMNFESVDGREVLSSYTISGKQKMVMKSDLDFSLSGKLIVNP